MCGASSDGRSRTTPATAGSSGPDPTPRLPRAVSLAEEGATSAHCADAQEGRLATRAPPFCGDHCLMDLADYMPLTSPCSTVFVGHSQWILPLNESAFAGAAAAR
jgi:hypothetical protein